MEWKKVAERILEEENKKHKYLYPPGIYINFEWRGDLYLGTLHQLEIEEIKGMGMLSKPSKAPPKELMEEITKLQPERPHFVADEELELDGQYHMIGLNKNRLIRMSPEQSLVASELNININGIEMRSQRV